MTDDDEPASGATQHDRLPPPPDDDDFGPPPPDTETYEEHLAALREAIAEIDAGVPGIPFREAMAMLDAEIRRMADGTGD